jgi:Uma2 family endonuclease
MAIQRVDVAQAAEAPPEAGRRLAPPPPLQNGDRLTRAEFERRYEAMPWLKKAELIDGVVYVGSPVRMTAHGRQESRLTAWLGLYSANTPMTDFGTNATVRLGPDDNEPQPDVQLRIDERAGGRSAIDEDGYVEGAPELVAEVAASSASYDRHDKMEAYRQNGVLEYLLWRVLDGEIEWFALEAGAYVRLEPDAEGVIHSRAFPGLRLNVPALLAGRLADVLATQQAALGSDEHRRFVERLTAAA